MTAGPRRWRIWYRFAAPIVDRAVAGVALIVLGPLLLLMAALIKRDSPGPALFRQERVGRDGRRFTMLKFRSMHVGVSDARHRAYVTGLLTGTGTHADAATSDGVYKLENDDRVTRIGRVLRRSGADELPQLVNVLRGEMALVGPRPALDYEVELYHPADHERFAVPPGITGLWQATSRNEVDMRTMLDLDRRYVATRSPLLDIRIIARTIAGAVSRRGGAR
ncbi:MAG: sugar transferase [Actinomycetota bacterium]